MYWSNLLPKNKFHVFVTVIANPQPRTRNRVWLALACGLVIVAGLASRAYPSLFPAVLGSHTGDALWALMVFIGFTLLAPGESGARLAVAALSFSWLIEASQLYQAPWINAVRATKPGHLVLGTGFQWWDLVAYAAGVGFGFAVDAMVWRGITPRSGN